MDSKKRFSTRAEYYSKYRPGYPGGVIETLMTECDLTPESVIADVGSGTGLLSRLFLEYGCKVFGIEPNDEMRTAGERLLVDYPNFISQSGSAEESGLPDSSVDFISAGQAFHWFNPAESKTEFQRILRSPGWVVLVWNERRTVSTPFLRDYEAVLESYATDYKAVNHRNVEEDPEIIPGFFNGNYKVTSFDNIQRFDFEGVRGRALSSSYVPEAGQAGFEPMMEELKRIFELHQNGGLVNFEYDTRMFYGRLK